MSNLVNIAMAAFTGGISVVAANFALSCAKKGRIENARDFSIAALVGALASGVNIPLAFRSECPKPAPVTAPAAGAVLRAPREIPQVIEVPVKNTAPAPMV